MRKSIAIVDNKDGTNSKGSIPQLLSDALAVSFDTNIGHDFIENSGDRFNYYHEKIKRVPFSGLEMINKITKGGLPIKTLNLILGGVNVGKSLFMCHCAADNLRNGYNVLYITLEMSEEQISQRIDANLLDVPMDQIEGLSKENFETKINTLRSKTEGRLIVKEYPTVSAGAAHFRHLIHELKIKKNFAPDIVYIDYLNICVSSRVKMGNSVNSYTYMKSVAEELRGLAVELKIPIVSATQLNRQSYADSDPDMTAISESFGVAAVVDFMIAVISNEDLQESNMYLVKQIKTRYNDISFNRKFMIGVDKSKMRLYDIDEEVKNEKSVMDSTDFMQNYAKHDQTKNKFDKNFFKDFK